MHQTRSITLTELAQRLGGSFHGNPDLVLMNIAKIEDAGEGDLTFVANPKYRKFLDTTHASAVIVAQNDTVDRADLALIRVPDPYLAFVKALQHFQPSEELLPPGIHERSVVAASATVGVDVRIGPYAVVGENVRIGDHSRIGAGVVIGNGVSIGEGCIFYPNVTLLAACEIGSRVIIHSGSVIGSDGFGFAPVGDHYEKIPQLGTVRIGDDVEIGSNCSIDRATIGATHIHRGVKIDNLVQIAHNVEIGEDTVIAAQSGISGSTSLGKHVLLGGQVGIVGHVSIAEKVTVTAQAGVSKSLTESGKMYRGSPAKEFHEELRMEAAVRQLPELIKLVRSLQEQIEKLRKGEAVH